MSTLDCIAAGAYIIYMDYNTLYMIGAALFTTGVIIGYLWGQNRMLRRHEYMMLEVAMSQLKSRHEKASRW